MTIPKWLRGDGSTHLIKWSSTEGKYELPHSLRGNLIATQEAGMLASFRYQESNGMSYTFEMVSGSNDNFGEVVVGRLQKVSSKYGQEVELTYESGQGNLQLQSARDTSALPRELRFEYSADGNEIEISKYDRGEELHTAKFVLAAGFAGKAVSQRRLVSADSDGDGTKTDYNYFVASDLGDADDLRVGMLSAAIEPDTGRTHQYEYFSNRRAFKVLTSVRKEGSLGEHDTVEQTYNYDLFRNVTEFTDQNGNTTTLYHRTDGFLERQRHADGTYLGYEWGAIDSPQEGLLLSSTDVTGATTLLEYYGAFDSAPGVRRFGEVKSSLSPDNIKTEYKYFVSEHPEWKHLSTIEETTTRVFVAPAGDSTGELVPEPGGVELKSNFVRNVRGDVIRSTDAEGNVTQYTRYDIGDAAPGQRGKIEKEFETQSQEQIANGDAASGIVYQYNRAGQRVAAQVDGLTPSRTFYDHHGNATFQTDATGVGTVFKRDSQGRVTRSWQTPNNEFYQFDELSIPTHLASRVTTLDQGRSLLLNGSTFAIGLENSDLSVSVTEDVSAATGPTILEFSYLGTGTVGHLHGFRLIGQGQADQTFKLAGGWNQGSSAHSLEYVSGDGWRHYRINLTELGLEGNYQRIDLIHNVNNYPAAQSSYKSTFSDFKVYQQTSEFDDVGLNRIRYSDDGQALQTWDAVNSTTQTIYTDRGLVAAQVAHDRTTTRFEYDSVGNLVTVFDALGNKTENVYDSRNRIIQTLAADGTSSHRVYNGAGRLVASINALGAKTKFTYDSSGRQLTTSHEVTLNGNSEALVQTENRYDPLGRLVESVDARGNLTAVEYDNLNRAVKSTKFDGPDASAPALLVTRSIYNAKGEMVQVAIIDATQVDPDNIQMVNGLFDRTQDHVQVETFVYDVQGRRIETIHADGTVMQTRYDDAGRPVEQIDELGRSTKTEYDAFGRQAKTTFPDADGDGPLESLYQRVERDNAGRVLREHTNGSPTGPDETTQWFKYDRLNRVLATSVQTADNVNRVFYDALGRAVTSTDALSNSSYSRYDSRGRVVSTHLSDPDGDGQLQAPASHVDYDEVGQVISETDPRGIKVYNQYDSLGRHRSTSQWHSTITDNAGTVGFNATGSPELAEDAQAWGAESSVWSDFNGKFATWTFPETTNAGSYRVSITADALTNENARLVVFVDGVRVAELQRGQNKDANTFAEQHGQKNISWLVVDQQFATTSLTATQVWQDGLIVLQPGSTVAVRLVGEAAGALAADAVRMDQWVTNHFEYDADGNLMASTDTLGRTTDFEVDALGRTTAVSLPESSPTLPRLRTETDYDGFGNTVETREIRPVAVTSNTPTRSEIGDIRYGVAVDDHATGGGFVMFSPENVFERFSGNKPWATNSHHLIAVRNIGGQWMYNNNYIWIDFTPSAGDRLLAEVDFTNDQIVSLQGFSGEIDGIEQGFSSGDLTFQANLWNGAPNYGEFTVGGSFFEVADQSGTRNEIGDIRYGVAVDDHATGSGFVMFSPENVFERFSGNKPWATNSHHLIAVRNIGGQWMYNNNYIWIDFTPSAGDRLLAEVDFTNDQIASLQGFTGEIDGIEQGFSSGDLTFQANLWNGAPNYGEFTVGGSFFEVADQKRITRSVFDKRNRLIAESIIGAANDGSDLTASWKYDRAGNVVESVDTLGIVDVSRYDNLNRATESIAAFREGRPADNVNLNSIHTPTGLLGSPASITNQSEFTLTGDGTYYVGIDPTAIRFNTVVEFDLQTDDAKPDLKLGFDENGEVTPEDTQKRIEISSALGFNQHLIIRTLAPGHYRISARVGDLLDSTQHSEIDAAYLVFFNFFAPDYPHTNPTTTFSNFRIYDTDEVRTGFTYDVRGNLAETKTLSDPRATTIRQTFDSFGRITRTQAGYNQQSGTAESETSYTYDIVGNLLTSTDLSASPARVTSYRYDNLYRQIWSVQPNSTTGEGFEFGSDPDAGPTDRPATRYHYDSAGNIVETVNSLGERARSAYDSSGNTIASWDGNGAVSRSAYDSVGNLLSFTDAEGNSTRFEYDSLNRQILETNANGNTRQWLFDGNGNNFRTIDRNGRSFVYQYDLLDRVVSETWLDATTQNQVNQLTWTYDDGSRLTQQTDGDEKQAFEYDELGRIVSQVDSSDSPTSQQPTIEREYDYQFIPTLQTGGDITWEDVVFTTSNTLLANGSGSGLSQISTRDSYDTLGRLIGRDTTVAGDPDGSTRLEFTYNGDSSVASVSRNISDGLEVDFEESSFDIGATNLGVTATDNATGTGWLLYSVENVHDRFGYSTSNTNTTGIYSGNALHVITVRNHNGQWQYSTNWTWSDFTPESTDVLLAEVDFDADTVDSLEGTNGTINGVAAGYSSGDLIFIADWWNGVSNDGEFGISGSLFSRYADEIPTQLVTHYGYDGAGRIDQIAHQLSAPRVYNFGYDLANRIDAFDILDGGFATDQQDFGYDEDGQLTNNDGESLSYDDNGNRVDVGGQAVQVGPANRIINDGNYEYDYDAEGNLTERTLLADGSVRRFEWDHLNRLVKVSDHASANSAATNSTAYTYNPSGEIVRITHSGSGSLPNEYFSYENGVLREELSVNGGNVRREHLYTYGSITDQPLIDSVFENGANFNKMDEILYLLGDHQNSTRQIVDPSGTVRKTIDYDAFGNITDPQFYDVNGALIDPFAVSTSTDAVEQTHFYAGRMWDEASGTYDYRARRYSAELGRFLSEDPLGLSPDSNPYRYVGNSATNYVDPTGMFLGGILGTVVKFAIGAVVHHFAENSSPGFGVGVGGGNGPTFTTNVGDFDSSRNTSPTFDWVGSIGSPSFGDISQQTFFDAPSTNDFEFTDFGLTGLTTFEPASFGYDPTSYSGAYYVPGVFADWGLPVSSNDLRVFHATKPGFSSSIVRNGIGVGADGLAWFAETAGSGVNPAAGKTTEFSYLLGGNRLSDVVELDKAFIKTFEPDARKLFQTEGFTGTFGDAKAVQYTDWIHSQQGDLFVVEGRDGSRRYALKPQALADAHPVISGVSGESAVAQRMLQARAIGGIGAGFVLGTGSDIATDAFSAQVLPESESFRLSARANGQFAVEFGIAKFLGLSNTAASRAGVIGAAVSAIGNQALANYGLHPKQIELKANLDAFGKTFPVFPPDATIGAGPSIGDTSTLPNGEVKRYSRPLLPWNHPYWKVIKNGDR